MKIDKLSLDGKKDSIEVLDKIFSGKIYKQLVNNVLYKTNANYKGRHAKTKQKNEIIVGPKKKLIKRKIRLKELNLLHENNKELENELFVKVRSTGKLIKAKVELDNGFANVDLQEDEYGISPGQACVFYLKNKEGYKVLGGGWIKK